MKRLFTTLHKPRRILRQFYKLYCRKSKTLSPSQKEEIQSLLLNLQATIAQKDVENAHRAAKLVIDACSKYISKNSWDHLRDFFSAMLFALVVAIVIRQMWFELYVIPSGSMRPTLKEADYLLVSKTDFGINTLTRTSHLLFDPSLIKRGQIVIFSVDHMDVSDPDTMYFYIIPGKKQFVKRLIGKPGDTLYFYGGRIYGIDNEGNDLTELRESSWSQNLEHIPFMRFDGKPLTSSLHNQGIFSPVVFYQMNEPVAKLTFQTFGKISGEMLAPVKNYFDLWGFKNFAMARLLTSAELKQLYRSQFTELPPSSLYLELTHHPSLVNATLARDEYRRLRPDLSTSVSIVPLDQEAIDAIMHHMATCRFMVKDGLAARYDSSFSSSTFLPEMKNIENGTYEILNGKAYRILWGGIALPLSDDHPLLSTDPQHVQQLFNLGIEMDTHFSPSYPSGLFSPSRYAYFRNQDLYLLGASVLKQSDPAMSSFLQRELQKQAASIHYYPFEDMGPPLTATGEIDRDFIKKYGLKVPEKMYLVLGDNHAMSADSRHFGFVPQDNLRGGASWIVWPFGSRWGRLPQPNIAHLTFPNLSVWALFLVISTTSTIYLRRKYSKPLKF